MTEAAPADDDQAGDGAIEGSFWPIPENYAFHGDVWHYTNATGLEGIVKSGELRASSTVLLNDPQELLYGAKRIRHWWKENRESLKGEAPRLVPVMDDQLDGFEEAVLNNPAYVVCASEKSLLSQWRNYASTNGFAIKLDATPSYGIVDEQEDPKAPGTTSMPEGQLTRLPSWVRVAYKPSKQDELIRRFFEKLSLDVGHVGRLLQQDDVKNARTLIEATIAGLAAMMKHPAYREEREVRLIAYLPSNRHPGHYPAQRGVVPFVRMIATDDPFPLNNTRPYRQLPIKEVRVGPPQGQTERQRRLGAQSLLRAHGFNAPVKGSGIPFIP
ncbi:MAG: DUF2971 domain-containing protein [Microbacterium enclense]